MAPHSRTVEAHPMHPNRLHPRPVLVLVVSLLIAALYWS